jgi:N-methylhydantoinase B
LGEARTVPGSPRRITPREIGDDRVTQGCLILRRDAPGGGGHGDALMREPQRVLDDMLEGNISPEAAERDYGVVLAPDGGSWTIDEAATAARRKQLRAGKT